MKKTLGILATTLLASAATYALEFNATGGIVWRYLSEPYSASYDSGGVPYQRSPLPVAVDAAFYDRIRAALPEGRDTRRTNPAAIANDDRANIHFVEDCDVSISFLHEGAGYRNSVGVMTWAGAAPTNLADVNGQVAFPNASYSDSGGSRAGLNAGDTVSLGRINAGTNLGFFIVANGFRPGTGVASTGAPVYFSLRDLNPESDPSLRPHSVVLYDAPTSLAVIGFEDINRQLKACDQDFNDVVILIHANPPTAIDVTRLSALPDPVDSDNDGVLDGNDEFPNDPERAFRRFWPAQGQSGMLAFEDLWPQQGDYDLNDLTLRIQCEEVIDSAGRVKDANMEVEILCRGANQRNSFALAIPDASVADVSSASLTIGEGPETPISPEFGSSELVWIVIEDAHVLAPEASGDRFFNTEAGAAVQSSPVLRLAWTYAQARNHSLAMPWNPFIAPSAQRGREIHLPGFPPTSRADRSLFGTADDGTTNTGAGRYKTRKNLPFAVLLPELCDMPLERQDILGAYPLIASWAESGGSQNPLWYRQPQVNRVFRRQQP